MIEEIQQDAINVISPDWATFLNHLSYDFANQESDLDAFDKKANSDQTPSVDLTASARRDRHNVIHIRMPNHSAHPLYICEYEDKTFLSDYVGNFYHLGMTDIDENYLSGVAHQGFASQHKTLLRNVRSLYSNEQYACKSEHLVWLSQPAQGILAGNTLSKKQEMEIVPFDKIPDLSLSLFSPLDHRLYLDAWCYFQTTHDLSININEIALRANLQISEQDFILANGPLLKKVYKDRSKQDEELKQQWQISQSELTLQDYIWQEHRLPFVKSLLTTLAYRHSKTLVFCHDSQETLPWKDKVVFQESDKPIHNLFEAFQRLFFYGNKWLVNKWLFIPPLISSKLVRKRSGDAHRLFLYATSLDYLIRFHPMKHNTPTE